MLNLSNYEEILNIFSATKLQVPSTYNYYYQESRQYAMYSIDINKCTVRILLLCDY